MAIPAAVRDAILAAWAAAEPTGSSAVDVAFDTRDIRVKIDMTRRNRQGGEIVIRLQRRD